MMMAVTGRRLGASASPSADTIGVLTLHVLFSMPSSELSNALNPNVVRQRNYDDVLVYQDQQAYSNLYHPNFDYEQPPQQPRYEYVPHRSELELAVVEPTPPQRCVHASPPRLRCSDKQHRPRPPPINPTQELLRLLASLKASGEAEKTRRLAWEEEHEARSAKIQEENERRFRAMQEEIDSLKEHIRHFESATTITPTTSQLPAPEIPRDPTPFQDIPQDHLSNQVSPYPLFVQGSSTDPTPYQANGILVSLANTDDNLPNTRKRTTSPSSGDDDSSGDDGSFNAQRPSKRINGHDTRCLTIQVYSVISVAGLVANFRAV